MFEFLDDDDDDIFDFVENIVDETVDLVETAVDTTLDVGIGLIHGEMPSKDQLVTVLATGISIYEISSATGFAVEVLQAAVDE